MYYTGALSEPNTDAQRYVPDIKWVRTVPTIINTSSNSLSEELSHPPYCTNREFATRNRNRQP